MPNAGMRFLPFDFSGLGGRLLVGASPEARIIPTAKGPQAATALDVEILTRRLEPVGMR